ncbi:MAG TPA: nickel-binding protein [Candidatus Acidoferrales bacterium]|nr:nickel-binding protein [Candidatus Acidoferrales bacterium]
MAIYLVDRHLPGITREQLAAAQAAAIRLGKEMSAQGKKVRYIRSTFVPAEAHCMCMFEADRADFVKELNETAKIPFTRILEAEDLSPR